METPFPRGENETYPDWLERAIVSGQTPAVIAGITTLVQTRGKKQQIGDSYCII